MTPAQTLAAIADEYANLLLVPNAPDYQQRKAKIASDIRRVIDWLEIQLSK